MARRYGAAAATDDTPKVKPRNDVYTGLLAISLVGMLISCVLLFLDYNQYPEAKPPQPNLPPVPKLAKPVEK